jgi:hypothetical protein
MCLAAHNNTDVHVDGLSKVTTHVTLDAGHFQQLDVPSDVYLYIQASKPSLVIQYCKTRTFTRVHKRTRNTHTHTHTDTHAHINACMHAHPHTQTHIHIPPHTHT